MQSEEEEDEREADYWGRGRDLYKEIPVTVSRVGSLHPPSEQPHITPETAF